MAYVNCPGCDARLTDWVIESIAKGSTVVGSGGIICPSCRKQISNREIFELLNQQINHQKMTSSLEAIDRQQKIDRDGRQGAIGCLPVFATMMITLFFSECFTDTPSCAPGGYFALAFGAASVFGLAMAIRALRRDKEDSDTRSTANILPIYSIILIILGIKSIQEAFPVGMSFTLFAMAAYLFLLWCLVFFDMKNISKKTMQRDKDDFLSPQKEEAGANLTKFRIRAAIFSATFFPTSFTLGNLLENGLSIFGLTLSPGIVVNGIVLALSLFLAFIVTAKVAPIIFEKWLVSTPSQSAKSETQAPISVGSPFTTSMVLILELDERFYSLSPSALKQLLRNMAWYLVQEIKRQFPLDTVIDLKYPDKHLQFVLGSKERGLIFQCDVNPLKLKNISDYATNCWTIHRNEAYLEWTKINN